SGRPSEWPKPGRSIATTRPTVATRAQMRRKAQRVSGHGAKSNTAMSESALVSANLTRTPSQTWKYVVIGETGTSLIGLVSVRCECCCDIARTRDFKFLRAGESRLGADVSSTPIGHRCSLTPRSYARPMASPASPLLSSSQLATLASLGEERSAGVGDVLYQVGDAIYPFIAIREGEVAILDAAGNEIVRHGASGFLGELNLL